MNLLKDMKLFVTIVHCDGLAAAGRELDMTPSSVSMRVKNLEKHYRVKLLARTTRSINLTDSGREFYLDCLKMLETLDEVESKLSFSNESISGPIRVSATSDLGRQHIAPLLSRFQKKYPAVKPFLNLSDSVTDLTENNIDIAIRYGIDPNSQLVAHKVAESRRVLCASKEYLKRRGVPESPQDLTNHDCLAMVQTRTPRFKWFFTTPEGELSLPVHPVRTCDDGALIRQWAVEGAGIALKSYLDIVLDLQSNRLVTVLDEYQPDYQSKSLFVGADLYMAYQDRNYIPGRIREFSAMLKHYFKEELCLPPGGDHKSRPADLSPAHLF